MANLEDVAELTMNTIPPTNRPVTHFSVLFARIAWTAFGPCALVICGSLILQAGTGWFTALDAVFLGMVALILFARWYELRSGEGTDHYGQPATLASYPGFVVRFLSVSIGSWVVANVIGNHFLQ
jgi:hypothetical protein